MFETTIQMAWKNYTKDYAFTRIFIWTCLFQIFLFFLFLISFGEIIYEPLLPVLFGLIIIYLFRMKALHKSVVIFIANIIFLSFTISLNYILVAVYDRMSGGLTRLDSYFSQFDYSLFGMSASEFIYNKSFVLGFLRPYYYGFLQVSYFAYYLFPILGSIFYFRQATLKNKYKVGRFIGSVAIFFSLNYLFYLLVPVSGPIYYLRDSVHLKLPFDSFGALLNGIIEENHPNFIDCFPSGHTGISVLVTFWMFKIKNHYRYVFLIFCLGMIQATLALKYHYTLDVISAIPFAFLCYYFGKILVPSPLDIRFKRKWRI